MGMAKLRFVKIAERQYIRTMKKLFRSVQDAQVLFRTLKVEINKGVS
jgi:hypothetical protein